MDVASTADEAALRFLTTSARILQSPSPRRLRIRCGIRLSARFLLSFPHFPAGLTRQEEVKHFTEIHTKKCQRHNQKPGASKHLLFCCRHPRCFLSFRFIGLLLSPYFCFLVLSNCFLTSSRGPKWHLAHKSPDPYWFRIAFT